MKGYKNGSGGEGEMGYLRGKDIAKGFKAVNPAFFKKCGFFLPLTLIPFHPAGHKYRHILTYMHKCTLTGLSVKSSYGVA